MPRDAGETTGGCRRDGCHDARNKAASMRCFAIKKHHHETEVILLTGNANTQDGVEGIKSGAFDYLTKPVEFEHLLGKIVQAYDKILSDREQKAAKEYKARIEQQMIATERLAALGTLAAGVAHEINNPLAIINESAGYLKTVLQKKELAEIPHRASFDKALEKIETSVKRARTITHQLLADVGKKNRFWRKSTCRHWSAKPSD
jgi:two-component system NtrC family sensor kinase